VLEIRWSDWSEQHIARHGVSPPEVEEAAYARPRLRRKGRNETICLYGTTESGRYLFIVLSEDDNGETAFVVTARAMTDNEKAEFLRKAR